MQLPHIHVNCKTKYHWLPGQHFGTVNMEPEHHTQNPLRDSPLHYLSMGKRKRKKGHVKTHYYKCIDGYKCKYPTSSASK